VWKHIYKVRLQASMEGRRKVTGDGYDGEAFGQWYSLASHGTQTRHRIRANLIDVAQQTGVHSIDCGNTAYSSVGIG